MAAVLVPLSYLLGTFPTAALIGRGIGLDPGSHGSRNPGASNLYRLGGARAGLATFAGDFSKGALATLVGLVAGDRPLALACGIAAVLGHVAPVTRRFRGGRGVATAAGVVLVLFPLVAVLVVPLWLGVLRLGRAASVASLAAAVAVPIGVALSGRPGREVAATVLLAAVVVARHAANVRRLLDGEELALREGGRS